MSALELATAFQGAPLSYGQRALWFLQRLAPAGAAYNSMFALRIRSPLDTGALCGAFQALAERHPALRTTYAMRDGRPEQRVQNLGPDFAAVDAAAWSPAQLDEALAGEAHRPFDLAHGPILRVRVYHRGGE